MEATRPGISLPFPFFDVSFTHSPRALLAVPLLALRELVPFPVLAPLLVSLRG